MLRDETRTRTPASAASTRIAVGYPNTYFVGMSSLAFQWVVEVSANVEDVGVERFFAEPGLMDRTLECGNHLGNFDILAWTCSFELDAPNVLAALE